MAELARDIAQYLIDKGEAQGLGQDIFLNDRPESPDQLISISDTGGYPAELTIGDLRRTLQILIRGHFQGYIWAYKKAWNIYRALDRPGNRVLDLNGRQAHIKATQPPTPLGRDDGGRMRFVFNLTVTTRRD